MSPTNKNKTQGDESAASLFSVNNDIEHQTGSSTSTASRKTKRKIEQSNFTEPEETTDDVDERPHKRARHYRRVRWNPELVEVRTFQKEDSSEDSSSESELNHEADHVSREHAAEPLEVANALDIPEHNSPKVHDKDAACIPSSDAIPALKPHPAVTAMWEVVHEGERWKMDFIWEIHQVTGKLRDRLAKRKWRELQKKRPGIYDMLGKENTFLRKLHQERRAKIYGKQEKIQMLQKQRLEARDEYASVCRKNGYERWMEQGALEKEIETTDAEVEDASTASSQSEEEILLKRPEIPEGYPNDKLEAWRTRIRREIEYLQLGKDDSDDYWKRHENLMYEENFELYIIKLEHDAYLEEYKEYHMALHFPRSIDMEHEIRERRRDRRRRKRQLAEKGEEMRSLDFYTIWEEKIREEGEIQGLDEQHQDMWRRIREDELREKKPALWRLLKRGDEGDYWLEKARE